MIELILKHKGAAAIAGVLFLLVVCIGVLKTANAELSAKLATANAEVQTLSIANQALADSIGRQNAAIARMQDEAMERKREADKAVAKAREAAAVYERTAMSLMKRTATGDECAATKALMDEFIR